jgi:hypothetical protein
MTDLDIFKWLVLTALGGFVYMLKRELSNKDSDIKTLQGEIQNIKQNYLHRDDFKDFKIELRGMFEDIRKDIRSLGSHNEKS